MTQSDNNDSVISNGREYHRVFDDHGHPVVGKAGTLDVYLLPGFYTVQFAPEAETYPLELDAPIRRTEAMIRAGPTCPKPEFRYYNHSDVGTEPPIS